MDPVIRLMPRVFALVLAALLVFMQTPTFAVSQATLNSLRNNRPWYDPTQECSLTGEDTGTPITGSAFVLGDSITVGAKTEYESALSAAGFTSSVINASSGRGIQTPGTDGDKLSGAAAVEANKGAVKAANTIVIALGTNGGNTAATIGSLIDQVKVLSPQANIYWVDTTVIGRPSYVATINSNNVAIYDTAPAKGYTVISWASKVTPGVNPKALSGSESDTNKYIRQADQFVHPTSAGASAIAALVTDTIKTASGAQNPATAGSLSVRDKASQLVFGRANSAAAIVKAAGQKLGGIFVRSDNANDSSLYTAVKGSLGTSKAFVAVDLEGGRVQAPGKALVGEIPSASTMGAKSEDEIKGIAKTVGQKLAAYGINMDFAPVADIGGTNNAVIGDRAFANDASTVTKKAGAFAKGLSESNVSAVLKHFPGHGSTDGDSHKSPVQTLGLASLEARDIKPFKDLGNSPKTAIMMGHLKVPEWGATATSLNDKAYQYLRLVVGYNGVVVTDALDMEGIGNPRAESDRAVLAIKAGADMALINSTSETESAINKIEAAINSGEIPQARVDESLNRINTAKTGLKAPGESTASPSCTPCTSSTGVLPAGTDYRKSVFQYFLSISFTPIQAAAVIGNMIHESGVQPQRLQGTAAGVITPAASVPRGQTAKAWGLVQWDPAHKMIDPVGLDKADNPTEQLNFLVNQLKTSEKAAGDRLFAEDAKNDIEIATKAFISFERFKNWNNSAGASEVAERVETAKSVLNEFSGVTAGTPSSGGGDCGGGNTGISGVNCPAKLEEHPTLKGYFKLPTAENNEYTIYSTNSDRYGSKELVCVLYTVALAYNTANQGKSKLSIGDLNASGHKSHTKGIAVDLDAQGEIVAADHKNGGSKYSTEATIMLGKMFVDTGQIRNIWWCEPGATPKPSGVAVTEKYYTGNDGSTRAIRDYAKSKNALEGDMYCISGHDNHFHIDIKAEYSLTHYTP